MAGVEYLPGVKSSIKLLAVVLVPALELPTPVTVEA